MAALLAGNRRVWRIAALAALPCALLCAYYMLREQPYVLGSNSTETLTYVAPASPGQAVCVPGLRLPAGTARLRFQLVSATELRPVLRLRLVAAGRLSVAELPAEPVSSNRISTASFPIPSVRGGALPASVCLSAEGSVNWGGTPLTAPPRLYPPTSSGVPIPASISVWYEPPTGARRSLIEQAGAILSRAALFRSAWVAPWVYALLLALVLAAGIASVRCLALAVEQGRTPKVALGRIGPAGAVYLIAFLNFAAWALITPTFQAPDEVDHFAYTQSLVERGESPRPTPGGPLARWSGAEGLLLEDMSFSTDHQVGDSYVPWQRAQQRAYQRDVAQLKPSAADGGGNETAATHGPIYYAALAPAYALAGSSPLSQLTLMRLASALLGALTVLFTYLMVVELAPGRPWLAVLAALLVAFQPMYGFISGIVNNDVGVNAGAAALELLSIRVLRRGLKPGSALLLGALLVLLPLVKGTILSVYPVVALALGVALWRGRDRWRTATVALTALAFALLVAHFVGSSITSAFAPPSEAGGGAVGTSASATSEALHHPLGYLAYVWELFLPRLSFMAAHFTVPHPGFVIYDERAWGAFGWYDVFFPHWVYVLLLGAMLAVPLLAVGACLRERAWLGAHVPEALVIVLTPIAVVAGVEAAFYTTGVRPAIAEFGRYAFPAIGPLSALTVGSLHAFGRSRAPVGGAALLVAMISLGFAGQLVTLSGFYA